MKCQVLFSVKIRKNIVSLSSAEFDHSLLSSKSVRHTQSLVNLNLNMS